MAETGEYTTFDRERLRDPRSSGAQGAEYAAINRTAKIVGDVSLSGRVRCSVL